MLLLTVDVEEDMPGWRVAADPAVTNVAALPRLAKLCRELGVRPTYLCNYPVATQEPSAALVRELHAAGDCEIGTHIHAWNTPPYEGVPDREGDERRHDYYQFELAPGVFRRKLTSVHERLTQLTGRAPTSFRSGRFGLDDATLQDVIALGYRVDSSVTPLADHTADGGPDFRDAPQLPYRPSAEDLKRPGDLPIVEVPVSIALTRKLSPALARAYVRLPKVTRLRGLLSRDFLGLVDFAWLYPVRFDEQLMKKAADTLVGMQSPVLNVFLHSSELAPGVSGRIRTEEDVERCFTRLRAIFEHCLSAHDARPATLTEAGDALRPALGLA